MVAVWIWLIRKVLVFKGCFTAQRNGIGSVRIFEEIIFVKRKNYAYDF